MAEMLVFPLHRRVGFIRKHAAFFLSHHPAAGEKSLQAQLDIQRSTLLRRGIEPELVELEITQLEGAIRAEAWRRTFFGGGAA
jgi:hypothetical protein